MAHQIIRQPEQGPDGALQYAIYSTVSDTLIAINATRQEIIDFYVERAKQEAERATAELLDVLEDFDDPHQAYFQFALTWDEAVENHLMHGGIPLEEFDG